MMSESFRTQYDSALQEIEARVLRMGNLALEMVRLACESVLSGNVELAAQVQAMDDEVDRLQDECVLDAMKTVMRETPVARDLRRLTATIGIVGEIEKAGDDAVKLSRRTAKLSGQIPSDMKGPMMTMGEQARKSFAQALRLYAQYEDHLAQEIIDGDQAIDQQYRDVRSRAKERIREEPSGLSGLLRTVDAFHALEHVADHAVEIAKRLRLLYRDAV